MDCLTWACAAVEIAKIGKDILISLGVIFLFIILIRSI